jgi:hypothetical protein
MVIPTHVTWAARSVEEEAPGAANTKCRSDENILPPVEIFNVMRGI